MPSGVAVLLGVLVLVSVRAPVVNWLAVAVTHPVLEALRISVPINPLAVSLESASGPRTGCIDALASPTGPASFSSLTSVSASKPAAKISSSPSTPALASRSVFDEALPPVPASKTSAESEPQLFFGAASGKIRQAGQASASRARSRVIQ